MKRLRRLLITLLHLVVMGWLLTCTLMNPAACSRGDTPFTVAAWQTGDKADRGSMVQDLMDRRLLIRLNRDDVARLLGPPNRAHEDCWAYDLDFGTKFCGTPWPYILIVQFDLKSGAVKEVTIHE